MLIKKPADIHPSEITPPELYARRREFLKSAAALGAAALLPPILGSNAARAADDGLKPTPYQDVTSYNNFYEFGSSKTDPAEYAGSLKTKPWTVTVEGHCEKPGQYALEDFLAPHQAEEHIYRLRCVEAWSMVVPWLGIPLGKILPRFQPTSNAKYVELITLLDPAQMPGQASGGAAMVTARVVRGEPGSTRSSPGSTAATSSAVAPQLYIRGCTTHR